MPSLTDPYPAGQPGSVLLIDAENVNVNQIGLVITHLQAQTPLGLKRAYGDWFEERLKGWRSVLASQEIEPVHVLPTASGKNAADIRLVIDAMELLYVQQVRRFCIVSSDRDFTPLVRSLKQAGATVIGYGRQNAAVIFKSAYHQFYALEELANPTLVSAAPGQNSQPLLQLVPGNASAKSGAKSGAIDSSNASNASQQVSAQVNSSQANQTQAKQANQQQNQQQNQSEQSQAKQPNQQQKQSDPSSAKPHAKQLRQMLQAIYAELATNNDWITGSQLLTGLQKHCQDKLSQGFSCKLFGYSNFKQILSSINLFELDPTQKANTPLSERKLRIRSAA